MEEPLFANTVIGSGAKIEEDVSLGFKVIGKRFFIPKGFSYWVLVFLQNPDLGQNGSTKQHFFPPESARSIPGPIWQRFCAELSSNGQKVDQKGQKVCHKLILG